MKNSLFVISLESEEWLRAFISSDVNEFKEVRSKIASILQRHHVKPVYWEMLEKPSALSPEEFYLKYLEDCQLYIGIFGENDTLGTEKEYRESVTTGLHRWVFIKETNQRGKQISSLIELAEKEIVREEFTTNGDLLAKIGERFQDFLSQSTREYLELKKRRTQEFLADYRRNFLEPLLEQVQLIRTQLRNRQGLSYGDYWTPTKITNHPHYFLDGELKGALEDFFTSFDRCVRLVASAMKAYQEENCKRMTEFHVSDYVKGKPKNAQNRVYEQVENALYQTSLMHYDDLRQLNDDELGKTTEHLKNAMTAALHDPYIIMSYNVNRSLGELVKGIVKLNQQNDAIRKYLTARRELEKAANVAHELLWKRFVSSTGYQASST